MPTSCSTERVRGPRIASLLPGATEMALALGLASRWSRSATHANSPAESRDCRGVTRTRIPTAAPSRDIHRMVREALAHGESLYEIDAERLDQLAP